MTDPKPATLHWTTALVEAEIARARSEARAEEREACAQLAELVDGVVDGEFRGPIIPLSFTELAEAIRARGDK